MEELIEMIKRFNGERDWDKFHSPKNLAISISIESGELLEHFQWTDMTIDQIIADNNMLNEVREELADIFIYSLNLASKLRLDMKDAIQKKLEKNRKKYPVDKAKGSSKKYNTF